MLKHLKLGDQTDLSNLYYESFELSNILGSISAKQVR
jgi:hypothetical protein